MMRERNFHHKRAQITKSMDKWKVYKKITQQKDTANICKTLLLVCWTRMACGNEEPHFCINQNKNIDTDFYCNSNEFPNHLSITYGIVIFIDYCYY